MKIYPKQAYSKYLLEGNFKFSDEPSCSVQDFVAISTYKIKDDNLVHLTNNDYVYKKKICNGSNSKIYLGVIKNTDVIIKKISKNESWRNELNILKHIKKIDNKNLLELSDFYETFRYSYIITKYYDGLDLYEYIYKTDISLNECKKILQQMLICLNVCHENNIAHLDVKLENFIIVNPFKVILIDFGHSEIINKYEIKKYLEYGTIYYLCPEGYKGIYSVKSDIWSIGISLYLMLTHDFPFDSTSDKIYYKNVINKKMNLTDDIPNDFLVFINKCLDYDLKKRPYAEDLLKDNFFNH